jgi:hypothetical protein
MLCSTRPHPRNIVKEYNSTMGYPPIIETKKEYLIYTEHIQFIGDKINVKLSKPSKQSYILVAGNPTMLWFFLFRHLFYGEDTTNLLSLIEHISTDNEYSISYIWGKETVNEAHTFQIDKFNDSSLSNQIPKRFYFEKLETCKIPKQNWDYSSPYFQIDGL